MFRYEAKIELLYFRKNLLSLLHILHINKIYWEYPFEIIEKAVYLRLMVSFANKENIFSLDVIYSLVVNIIKCSYFCLFSIKNVLSYK